MNTKHLLGMIGLLLAIPFSVLGFWALTYPVIHHTTYPGGAGEKMMATMISEDADIALTSAQEPYLIGTSSLQAHTQNLEETIQSLEVVVNKHGGQIVSRHQSDPLYTAQKTASFTIQIPVDHWSVTLTDLRSVLGHIEDEQLSVQDVTRDVVDLQARLSVARAQEESYLALLKTTSKVEEILAIQRELSPIRSTIESLEAQQRYYGNQTQTHQLSLFITEQTQALAPASELNINETWNHAVYTLLSLAKKMLTLIIYMVVIGGGFLLPILGIALIVWLAKRRTMSIEKPRTKTARS